MYFGNENKKATYCDPFGIG